MTAKDYNTLRWISVIYMPVFVLGLTGSCLTPAKNRGQNRITLGFLLFAITIGLIPIVRFQSLEGDTKTICDAD